MRRSFIATLVVAVLATAAAQAQAPAPSPVRNDVHQGGEEIVTLRSFKIERGRFDEFLEASQQGVWPFFEKIGARVVGMWLVTGAERPASEGGGLPADRNYDEVYLMTRYASEAHWRATRDMARMGGNGPDWEKCREALARRERLTRETRLLFLRGVVSGNGPYFMPGLDERFRPEQP